MDECPERAALIKALDEEHNPSYWGGDPRNSAKLVDDYRDAVALQLGRDAMELGLKPFLIKLVGEANTRELLADVEHDAIQEYRFG